MPVGKKLILRIVLMLDLREGLEVADLLADVEDAIKSTSEDYGGNVTVAID